MQETLEHTVSRRVSSFDGELTLWQRVDVVSDSPKHNGAEVVATDLAAD